MANFEFLKDQKEYVLFAEAKTRTALMDKINEVRNNAINIIA